MVRARTALLAVLGIVLLAAFFAAPAVDPPDEYLVVVEQNQSASGTTAYDDLAAGDRAAFDAALANDGAVRYVGETYPDGVGFPDDAGRTRVTERHVEHEATSYDLRLVYDPTFPDTASVLRTLGTLVGGVVALAYAGYETATA
jgi:opacity protein-like surface antigen